MILDDYKCGSCDETVKDRPRTMVIPVCGACNKLMYRVLRAPGIYYKGPGFTGAQKEKRIRKGDDE